MVKHNHPDYRLPGDDDCRLSSACEACDVLDDSNGQLRYDAFAFAPKEWHLRPDHSWPVYWAAKDDEEIRGWRIVDRMLAG